MKRYGGDVIFQTRDDWGPIQVVQDAFERALHFSSEPKQSAMDLADPVRLVLSYTRAMLAFLLHHYPDLQVDVVELREQVVAVARDWFGLPVLPRLNITVDDAGSFVRAATGSYDLILVDAFDRRGIAYSVCGVGFFGALRERLAPGGLLAINLWARDVVGLEDMVDDITTTFDTPVARLPVQGKDNIIALAGANPQPRRTARALTERARKLEEQLTVEFPTLLRTLRKHNAGF